MKASWAPLLTDRARGGCRGGEAEGQVSSLRRRSFAPPLLQRPPPRLRKAQIDRTFRHTPVVVHPARGGRRAAPASEASARSRRFDQAASTCEPSSQGRTLLLLNLQSSLARAEDSSFTRAGNHRPGSLPSVDARPTPGGGGVFGVSRVRPVNDSTDVDVVGSLADDYRSAFLNNGLLSLMAATPQGTPVANRPRHSRPILAGLI